MTLWLMSDPSDTSKQVFDSLTVLQDVGEQSLSGKEFEAPDAGQEVTNVLVGVDEKPSVSTDIVDVDTETVAFTAVSNPLETNNLDNIDVAEIKQTLDALKEVFSPFRDAGSNKTEDFLTSINSVELDADSNIELALIDRSPPSSDVSTDDLNDVEIVDIADNPYIPKADTPSLSLESVSVDEDHDIPLDIQVSLNDRDGNETLHIDILDVPEGAVLSAGTDLGGGTWRLSPSNLNDLILKMPEHYSGDFSLTVKAVSTEVTGETAQISSVLDVSVTPIVDAPILDVTSAVGYEDSPIALDVQAELVDQDGSETLSLVTISDVPDGAILSAGAENSDGSYSLTLGELNDLTVTPPLHSNEDFTLSIKVTATESDGQSVTTTTKLPVSVTGVADQPIAQAVFGGMNIIGKTTITGANVLSDDQGFTVLARNVNEDGTLTEASSGNVGYQGNNGFGANGDTDNAWVDAETGWDPVVSASEELIIQFDDLVSNAQTQFGYFYRDWTGGIENGTVTGYRDGVEIGKIDFNALDDRSLNINFMDQPFDELMFNSHPYLNEDTINPTHVPMDSSDFTIKNLTFIRVEEIASDTVLTVEDTAVEIGYGLSGQLIDTDGSEVLGYVISDVPDGALLSKGLNNHDGTYSLTESDLEGLEFHPPENYSGTIPLTFTVITTENDGDQAFDSVMFNIRIDGVADTPDLYVQNAQGLEDQPVSLDIVGGLVDIDGSENLAFIISNMPDGARLSAGSLNSDGSYTLLSDDLDGLQVVLPQHSNEDFQLKVEAVATEDNGDKAVSTKFLNVNVTGVADQPTVSIQDTYGVEDQPIDLDVMVAHPDIDGSESFTYNMSSVPDGGSFNVGTDLGDGAWSFTASDLSYLSFIAPEHFSGDIDMALTSIATENNGDVSSVTEEFTVHVEARADEAIIDAHSVGYEDQGVPLNLDISLADQDGSEEITSIIISNIPDGVVLSAGILDEDGDVNLTHDQLSSLTFRAPDDSNQDFHLTINVETVDDNGDIAMSEQTFKVDLKGVADTPDVFANDAIGTEDTLIDMNFGGALNDLDGSERLFFDVRDIPEGMSFTTGRAINGGKHWRFNNEEQAEKAQMIPPKDFSGDIDLTFRAYARENDGNTARSDTEFKVSISGDADAPRSFTVREARGFEDNEIKLDIRYQLADNDGSEEFSIVISDIPDGTTFSHGEETNDGWVVQKSDISHLTVRPPQDSNEDFTLSVTGVVTEADGDVFTFDEALDLPVYVRGIADMPGLDTDDRAGYEDTPLDLELGSFLSDTDGSETLSIVISNIPDGVELSPSGTYVSHGTYSYTAEEVSNLKLLSPQDFSGDITLDVRAVAQENDGDVEVFNTQLNVNIEAVADAPNISGGASGLEDTAIDLNINLTTTDVDGSETIADLITITGVPEDAILSAGTKIVDGEYTLTSADLENLTITPSEHSNEDFTIEVTATSIDINGDETSATQALTVNVMGVADAPILTVGDVQAVGGQDVPLNINGALVDIDGSESLYFILDDVPEIYHVSNGTYGGNGRWIVQDQNIDDIRLEPLTYDPTDFQIQVTAVSVENDGDIAHTKLPLDITIQDVGGNGGLPTSLQMSDAPRFAASLGDDTFEDTQIDVDGTIYYTRGSELSFRITDIPDGVEPNLGFYDLDGGLIVPLDTIAQLRFEPVDDFAGDIQMAYEAIQIQPGKLPNSTTKVADIHLEAVADAPLIVTASVMGAEDSIIAIPIDVSVSDLDGSEHLLDNVTIENVPDGATLTEGEDQGGGVWKVPVASLSSLSFVPPAHAHGTYNLTVIATSEEAQNADQASSSKMITVNVDAVADKAILDVSAGQGKEDQWLDLNINAQFVDTDGSETMTIIVSGLPEEARLSEGLNNGDGSWTLKPNQVNGLQVRAPDDFSGTMNAQVTVNTIEPNGDVATISQNITLSFDGVSDGLTIDPTLSYSAVEDQEGGISIVLKAETLDRDGSETLEVIFSGVPEGATFSVGGMQGAGTWIITGDDVNDAVFFPPEDFSGQIDFDVRVNAVDSNGDHQGVDLTSSINVSPVADTPDLIIGTQSYEAEIGQFITLDVSAQLNDMDGSEELSMSISDVPDDVTFTSGDNQGNGVWLFEDIDSNAIEMQTVAGVDNEFALTLQVRSTEVATGGTVSSDAQDIFFLLHTPVSEDGAVATNAGVNSWIDSADGLDGDAMTSSDSWLESVEQDHHNENIQGGDGLGDQIDTTHNDMSNIENTQDQSEGGLFG